MMHFDARKYVGNMQHVRERSILERIKRSRILREQKTSANLPLPQAPAPEPVAPLPDPPRSRSFIREMYELHPDWLGDTAGGTHGR